MESAPDSSEERHDSSLGAAPAWHGISRGVALYLGAFTLLNLVGELRWSGVDAHFWWIDLRPCPPQIARGFLGLVSVVLILFAFRPQIDGPLRGLALTSVLLLLSGTLWNMYVFYAQLRANEFQTDIPIPFALHAAAGLIVVFAGIRDSPQQSLYPARDFALAIFAFVVCAVTFPLAQMFCNGRIDRRSSSDAVIVFTDESLSVDPASVEMQTATELHRDGLVPQLIVVRTGQSAATSFLEIEQSPDANEPRRDWLVIAATDWESAVEEVAARCSQTEVDSVLLVASYYELPRLEFGFRRQGLKVSSVPADVEISPQQLAVALLQEAARLWSFYLTALSE